MGIREKAEIFVTYIQYLCLIFTLDIDWPDVISVSFSWMSTIFLNFGMDIPGIPHMEFRLQFTIICVVIPLAFTLVLLLFFKRIVVTVWFFFLLAGVALILVGAVPEYLMPNDELSTYEPQTQYAFTGFVFVGICLVLWLVSYINDRRRGEVRVDRMSAEELDSVLNYAPPVSKGTQWVRGIAALICLILGLLLTQILFADSTGISKLLPLPLAWGICFLVVGLFLLALMLACMSYKGRLFVVNSGHFVRGNFTRFILFLLVCLYLPVLTTMFSTLNCFPYTCNARSEFIEKTIYKGVSSRGLFVSGAETCADCRFAGYNASNLYLAPSTNSWCAIRDETLCTTNTDWRLVVDSTLSCSRDIWPLFILASIFVFIAFVCGIPYFFYKLTAECARMMEEIPVLNIMPDGSISSEALPKSELWSERTGLTRNSAKMLYGCFEYAWRYYKLFQLMLRIALVLVVVLFGRYVAIALAGMVLVHGANFILSLVARPYINSVEDVLTAVCAFCSMITALLGLGMFAKRDSVPEQMIVAVVLGDLLIPILAFFVSAVVLMTRESQKQKRLKQMELEARSRAAYEMYGAAATGKDGGNMQDMQTAEGGHVSPYAAGPYYGPATVVPVTVIGDEVKPVSHSRSNTAAGEEVPIEQLSPAEKEIRRCRLALVLIDRKINARVIVVLSNFFMFIGFILFIALVFCVLSLLFQTNPDVIPPRPLRDIQSCDFSRRFNFAGYASWQEFTSNCCCTEAPSYDSYQSVEVWHCRNGRYKERVRAETGRGNGFALRGMCSPFFASGVGAPRCVKNAFQVTAGSAASAYALQNLW